MVYNEDAAITTAVSNAIVLRRARTEGDGTMPSSSNEGAAASSDGSVNKDTGVEALILNNFKSYRGSHVIGPFRHFTGVIGPNGAGKSNLMDAISFVLGVQARHMRGSSLADLIYRPSEPKSPLDEDEDEEDETDSDNEDDSDRVGSNKRDKNKADPPQQTTVTLVLRVAGKRRTFSRKVVRGGSHSVTQIDGKTVSAEEYHHRLAEINILVKAKNFLVFQGDVTDVARKTPAELGKLFEQISGSDELRVDYDKYEAEAKRMASELKHKTLNRQRCEMQLQDLEKQVAEVNEFRRLERQLAEARSLLLVYKLYVNEVRAGETKTKHDELQRKEEESEVQKTAQTQKLRQLDVRIQEHRIERQTVLQPIEGLTTAIAALDTEISNVTQRIVYQKKRRAELAASQDQKRVRKQSKEQELQDTREELFDIESNFNALGEKELKAKSNEVQFTAKQKKEYQQLQRQAAATTSGLKATLTAWEHQRKTLQEKVKDVTEGVQEAQLRLSKAEEREMLCHTFINKARPEIERLGNELKEKEKTVKEDQQNLEGLMSGHARHMEQKRQLEAQLERLNAGRGFNEGLEKRRQLIQELRAAFTGVYGPMNELHEPAQRKYATAILSALGKWSDTIIVDTLKTGTKAVDYLKRTRNLPMKFAPLDTVLRSSVDPRVVTSLQHLCKPALDCVQYDGIYDKAFRAALFDSVITENLGLAEQLAYTEAPRLNLKVKVITLDGEKVLKNGNFSVDSSLRNVNRGNLREDRKIREQLERLESIVLKEEDLNARKVALSRLVKEVKELQDAVGLKIEKLKMWEDKLVAAVHDVREAKELMERLTERQEAAEKELERAQEELKRVEAQVLTVEDELFAPLARQVNVADLRKFEEEQKENAQTRNLEREKLTRRLQKLKLSIVHLENEIKLLDLQQLEREAKENEKSLQKDSARLEECESQKAAHLKLLNDGRTRLDELTVEEKSMEAQLKKEREVLRSIQNQRTAICGEIQRLGIQNEVLLKEATDLLRTSLLDNIHIPLAHGTLRGYCRLLGLEDVMNASARSQALPLLESGELASSSSVFEEDVVMRSVPSSSCAVEEDEEAPEIDYQKVLSAGALDSCNSTAAEKAMERKFENRVGDYRSQILNSTPNLRATEKYDAVRLEMKSIEKEISSLEKAKDDNDRMFLVIKKERSKRFLDCFHQVQQAINQIYFGLTGGNGEDSIGGQAYLELESGTSSALRMDSNFSSGILYNVIPPMKRFSDLKRLSGGEKTIAALALLFALQSYHPAPFFVIDEIDADLDPVNILSLADYLRGVQFQVIIISHSDRVFSQADGLIGVYVDPQKESSGALSVDLTRYPREIPTLHAVPSPTSHNPHHQLFRRPN